MYHIDMAMYQQMGFSKQQVNKAYQFSQKNKVDMFDALQYLQKTQNIQNNQNNRNTGNNNYSSSQNKDITNQYQPTILRNFNSIQLSNYEILFSKKSSRLSLQGKRVDLREQYSPVGLLNVYNCCYLNSLLQCYFLSTDLIKYILQAQPLVTLQNLDIKTSKIKIKRIQNQYNLLHTLKDIFGRMCLTSKRYIDPTQVLKNLVDSVGEKIEFGQEKDLFQTNILFIERLNECLLYTKKYYKGEQDQDDQTNASSLSPSKQSLKSVINKSKIRQRDNIKRLFYGQKVQYTDRVGQTQQIVSDFLGIIINPAHENLYKALHQEFHYEVQIQVPEQKRKEKIKKHTYIRQVPEYLYFYINRTGYNAQQRQALKNQEKLSFDFVIYLDRFLEKYKQEASANTPLIIELWKKKNLLRKKINSFEIFSKKLQQCRQLAIEIDGWSERLPKHDQINLQKQKIQQQLIQIQNQLQQVQSRKQKYYLMYIFSHRGDAISGHYWGYGRNADNWYKFDINTKIIKQDDILLDLYKCGGTPYALVYVKQSNLPKFSYQYYKDFSICKEQSLLDSHLNENQKQPNFSYVKHIPQVIKKAIISQNIQVHQDYIKRRNIQITMKTVKQYLTRFNYLQSEITQLNKKSQTSFKMLPPYDNFALYLWFKNQFDLAKYNIFAVSFRSASTMSTKQLIEDQILLSSIQKQFRKKVKKNKILKHFCVSCQPKQGQRYSQLHKNYLIQKELFMILLKLFSYIDQIEKCKSNISVEFQKKINILLKRALLIRKIGNKNSSYIKHIMCELIPVFLLKYILSKGKLKLNQQQSTLIISEKLTQQLKILIGKQQDYLSVQKGQINEKQYYQSGKRSLRGDQIWNVQDLGKGPNRQILQRRFPSIMQKLKNQICIYKKLQKQNTYSQINKETGQIEDYVKTSNIPSVQSQSLI